MLSVEERLRRVREELRAEKDAHARTREAHERTCQELDDLKRLVAGLSGRTAEVGPDIDMALLSSIVSSDPGLPSSPSVPRRESVVVESTDTETPEPSVSVRGRMSPAQEESDVESASPIAKRVRNEPRTRHPSLLQISPYVNPVTKVYKSRKRETTHPVNEAPRAEKMEGDRGGDPIQVCYCYYYNRSSVDFLIRGTTYRSS